MRPDTSEQVGAVGGLVRRHRLSAGLSQQRLAERAGLSRHGIADLERGSRRFLEVVTARRLAEALGLTAGDRARLLAATAPDRTPPARARRLASDVPAPTSPLIGRGDEVRTIRALLAARDARLVTLTGPGGVGKTRLAVEVGAEQAAQGRHGVCWVDLTPLSDPGLVVPTIARRVGLIEDGREPMLNMLRTFLRPRDVLLILDNVEHLISAAPAVADLLAACPRLRVLATSREPLHVRGEHELAVPSLAVPEPTDASDPRGLLAFSAVALFMARARAVRPGFDLDSTTAPAVAEVCRGLDGLPLALELAAGRLKLLPPAALLSRLGRRLDLLTTGARDLPARQQTLRSAIGWSYDLLTDGEQAVFRRMAVFSGGCTLQSAEAVATGDVSGDGALDLIASLVDKSLLRADAGGEADRQPRVRMLETVRLYGLEQLLASGELRATQHRHAAWCLSLAEQFDRHWRGPTPDVWLDRVALEHDNMRAALSWSTSDQGEPELGLRLAGALWWFWQIRGYFSEGRSWLARVLAVPGAASATAARAAALNAAGHLAIMHGDLDAAAAPLDQSLSIRRDLADDGGIALALYSSGVAAYFRRDAHGARRLLDRSLRLGRQVGERAIQYNSLFSLAEVAQLEGDFTRAAALHEESLMLKRECGDVWSIGYSLLSLGNLALRQADLDRAAALTAEGLAIFHRLGDPRLCTVALSALSAVAAGLGWPERAARLLGAAEALRERLGMRWLPARESLHQHVLATIRARIGPASVAASMAAGRSLPFEQAIAEATSEDLPPAGRQPRPGHGGRGEVLTDRELEVLQLLARGLTSKEIAGALVVSARTVEHHRANLAAKLGAHGRAELLACAARLGWLPT